MDYFTFNGNKEQLNSFISQLQVDEDIQKTFYDILLDVALKDSGQQDILNSRENVELHIPRTLINIKISVVAVEIFKMLARIACRPNPTTIMASVFVCALTIYQEALDKLSDTTFCIFDKLLKEVYEKGSTSVDREKFLEKLEQEGLNDCKKILPTKVQCSSLRYNKCKLEKDDCLAILYELERKKLIRLDPNSIKVKL